MSRLLALFLATSCIAAPVLAAPAGSTTPPTTKQLRDDLKTIRQRIGEDERQLADLHKHEKAVTNPNEQSLLHEMIVRLNLDLAALHQAEDGVRRELDRRAHPQPKGPRTP